jgi:hypothetical protein
MSLKSSNDIMYVRVCVYILYIYTYIHIYIRVYIHTYTHTNTHTHIHPKALFYVLFFKATNKFTLSHSRFNAFGCFISIYLIPSFFYGNFIFYLRLLDLLPFFSGINFGVKQGLGVYVFYRYAMNILWLPGGPLPGIDQTAQLHLIPRLRMCRTIFIVSTSKLAAPLRRKSNLFSYFTVSPYILIHYI